MESKQAYQRPRAIGNFLKDEILGLFGKIPLKRIAILHIFLTFQPNLGGNAPNRVFLTPRGKVEPHYMRLNLIGKSSHAKLYVNRRFGKINLIGYI